MLAKHRQGHPFHAEADTRGMDDGSIGALELPDAAEVVAVIVEARAGGRLFWRSNLDQQLKFELLLTLTVGEQSADSTKEGIVGNVEGGPQA